MHCIAARCHAQRVQNPTCFVSQSGSASAYLSFSENSIKTRSDDGLTIASKHCAAVEDVMPPIAEFPIWICTDSQTQRQLEDLICNPSAAIA